MNIFVNFWRIRKLNSSPTKPFKPTEAINPIVQSSLKSNMKCPNPRYKNRQALNDSCAPTPRVAICPDALQAPTLNLARDLRVTHRDARHHSEVTRRSYPEMRRRMPGPKLWVSRSSSKTVLRRIIIIVWAMACRRWNSIRGCAILPRIGQR